MKYLVILILTGFIAITSVDMAFGMCATQNLDWPDAPCHDAGETLEERRHDWSHYYDLKSDDWMAAMKIQLMIALRDDVLNEWLDERDDVAHWNVYTYYDQFENLDKYGGVYSPLKQLDYGFGLENIKCKENLVLLQKHDGSPACVKPSSIPDLIKRNWMTTEVLLDMPLAQLGKECGHYSHNEFFSRTQNYTLDTSCHDFIVKKALEDEKKMLEQGYLFDAEEQVWKKDGFPDTMMSISYHYVMNLELENEN